MSRYRKLKHSEHHKEDVDITFCDVAPLLKRENEHVHKDMSEAYPAFEINQIKRGAKDYDYQLDIITTLDATFTNTVATFDTRGCEESVDSGTGLATTTMLSDDLITSTGVSRDANVRPLTERSYRATSAT